MVIDVSFYNSTASTWTLATPRTTWESLLIGNSLATPSTTCYSKPKYRIGQPNDFFLHYLEKSSLDQSIQTLFSLILKTEALVAIRAIETEEKPDTGHVAFI